MRSSDDELKKRLEELENQEIERMKRKEALKNQEKERMKRKEALEMRRLRIEEKKKKAIESFSGNV